MVFLLAKWGVQVSKDPIYSLGNPIGVPHWGGPIFLIFYHFIPLIFPARIYCNLGQNWPQKLCKMRYWLVKWGIGAL